VRDALSLLRGLSAGNLLNLWVIGYCCRGKSRYFGRHAGESLFPVVCRLCCCNDSLRYARRIHSGGSRKGQANAGQMASQRRPLRQGRHQIHRPCEDTAPFLLELGKNHFVVDERWGCKVAKITDTAPGALRLDMTCYEVDNPDEGEGKDHKDVMTLRKIGDTSFNMQLTNKGKFNGPPWRVNYCEQIRERNAAAAEEARRKPVKDEIDGAAWLPRDGIYATPGTDFDDHCAKSGDAVINLAEISVSSGASHCAIFKVGDSTDASIRLEARCEVKLGDRGQVTLSMGEEKLIITNSGHQTVTLQKIRNGESEPGQLLAFCPETTQRAYANSKKAK